MGDVAVAPDIWVTLGLLGGVVGFFLGSHWISEWLYKQDAVKARPEPIQPAE